MEKQLPRTHPVSLLEAEHRNVSTETLIVWTCPACAFVMDAHHQDQDGEQWTCPCCGVVDSTDPAISLRDEKDMEAW